MNFKALKKTTVSAALALTILVGAGMATSSTANAQDWRWRDREARREWREREYRRDYRDHYRYDRYGRPGFFFGFGAPAPYRNGYYDRWGYYHRY